MSAHTPGSWVVEGPTNLEPYIKAADQYVATCHDVKHSHETEANAHLVAAAPDLLAACQEMIRAFQSVYLDDVEQYPAQIRDEARAMIAAIAKARGGK